jgi:hypothetical protein
VSPPDECIRDTADSDERTADSNERTDALARA